MKALYGSIKNSKETEDELKKLIKLDISPIINCSPSENDRCQLHPPTGGCLNKRE